MRLASVVAMRFLVVGVVLRFVVFRGVVAVVVVLARRLVVLRGRERGACKYRQKQRHDEKPAHARILSRARSPSAKP
jgi:hypothetical protein